MCILYIYGGEDLEIKLNHHLKEPIYEQIYNQVRNHVVSGRLKPNEKLPSIRLLAKDLKVSVITTKRAYEDLERDGYIYSLSGKGSYVTDQNVDNLLVQYTDEIETAMRKIVSLAKHSNIDEETLALIYRKVKDEI